MNNDKPRPTPVELFRRFEAENDQHMRKERQEAMKKTVDAVLSGAVEAGLDVRTYQREPRSSGQKITSNADASCCVLYVSGRTQVSIERTHQPDVLLTLTFGYDPVDDVVLPPPDTGASGGAEDGESAEEFLARQIIRALREVREAGRPS